MHVLSRFSRVQLFATLWTVAHQVPLSMGILQEITLEWVAMPSSRGSSHPKHQTWVSCISCISRWALYHQHHLHQFSSVHLLSRVQLFVTPWIIAHQAPLSMGILQARILEWVAMPSSRGSSHPEIEPKSPTLQVSYFTIWATREALYAEYIMQNAGLQKLKLESRLPGEISITLDMQMTPPLWQKVKSN